MQKAVEADSIRFMAALQKCGVPPSTSIKDEPIRALYDRFKADITQHQLASELGQNSARILAALQKSKDDGIRLHAAKLAAGNIIPRANFFAAFRDFASELSLGKQRTFAPPPFEEFGGDRPLPPAVAAQLKTNATSLELEDAIYQTASRYISHGFQLVGGTLEFSGPTRILLPTTKGLDYAIITATSAGNEPPVIHVSDEPGARIARGISGTLEFEATYNGIAVIHIAPHKSASKAESKSMAMFARRGVLTQ